MNTSKLIQSLDEFKSLSNSEKFDSIILYNFDYKSFAPEDYNKLLTNISDNGTIEVSIENFSQEEAKKVSTNLKFAGYIKVKTLDNSITAKKKATTKTKDSEIVNASSLLKSDNKVELVMEEELIDPFNTYQKFAKEGDCMTRAKPCKNCTCGRAGENKTDLKDFKPECGKCYLGDAYRCEGCPYRGTPAFNPGDKIEIKSTQNGVGNVEAENVNVNVTDSKVKIDI